MSDTHNTCTSNPHTCPKWKLGFHIFPIQPQYSLPFLWGGFSYFHNLASVQPAGFVNIPKQNLTPKLVTSLKYVATSGRNNILCQLTVQCVKTVDVSINPRYHEVNATTTAIFMQEQFCFTPPDINYLPTVNLHCGQLQLHTISTWAEPLIGVRLGVMCLCARAWWVWTPSDDVDERQGSDVHERPALMGINAHPRWV